MGQNRQFKPGQKAPNNGIYIEIGETGSTVNNPQRLKLRAGDDFRKIPIITVSGHIKENHNKRSDHPNQGGLFDEFKKGRFMDYSLWSICNLT